MGRGHDLRISTVGEGFETPEQRDLLRRAGCNAVQGYLFGSAMPNPIGETRSIGLGA